MTDAGQVLIIDDEPQVVRALRPALSAYGFGVASVDDGVSALTHLAKEGCDVVLLDLGLPDMDGKSVITRIREWSQVPIVVISARDVEHEKIAALDLGADDFVNKPFAIGELLARMRAAMRGRERRFAARSEFKAKGLEINFSDRRVKLNGAPLRLTPREYELLTMLARHAGRVVTHRQIMASIRGADAPVDAQFVRVLVGQLRQKLEAEPSRPDLLLTEPGIGYRLIAED
jgi:two-component system KDP operon response regulator KdpE